MLEDILKGMSHVQIKEGNEEIKASLEFVLQEFPKVYDIKTINRNAETLLNATTEVLGIPNHYYKMVGAVWRISYIVYVNNLVFELKTKEMRGLIYTHIEEIDEDFAYQLILKYYRNRGYDI